jgi:hypothetical protein
VKKEKKNRANKWVLRVSAMLLFILLSLYSAYGIMVNTSYYIYCSTSISYEELIHIAESLSEEK